MPELPEVETTLRGISPHVLGKTVARVIVRDSRLRWPIPAELARELPGQSIDVLRRRGKYLLLHCRQKTLLVHLGMSGSLRIVSTDFPLRKHDHVDIVFTDGSTLRYTDPRRFGCLLWLTGDVTRHPLLKDLGPEPLTDAFDGDFLYQASRGKSVAVKNFIMDSHVVVGVGNIYANEALFGAGIHPVRKAGRVSRERYRGLAGEIKSVLGNAIRVGGTTLRDFTGSDGKPGYFRQSLQVYGRAGLPCRKCGGLLREIRLGQRSTVYCGVCQR
ncbi:MAG: hypothetical protein RLZZ385_2696 [Pseudomonadota bacterium]|jgi:formamidopyrimidine-DNA glycosylase